MIPFSDVQAANKRFEKDYSQKLQSVLQSGQLILGSEVKAFESEFANYCGSEYCLGVANGLDALILIFEGYKLLGKLSEGDEIIVPANTYIASILAISRAGLKPVLVEPNPQTFNIEPKNIQQAITPKTKGILAVHLYGLLCDMDELQKISKANNLLLIEDAAQAHGAKMTIDGNFYKAGNLSNAAGFSFYPTKNLGALGDAGAITSNDSELIEVVRDLRNYGSKERYVNEYQGFNSRLDELQAGFLRLKLPYLDQDNSNRMRIANRYDSGINSDKIQKPIFSETGNHVYHLYVIRSKNRDELQRYLTQNGVGSIVHYPVPPHKQNAYKEWNNLSFPITEAIHQEVLSLPMGPTFKDEQIDKVIQLLNDF